MESWGLAPGAEIAELGYRKSSTRHPDGYLALNTREGDLLERGLIKEGGLFIKSNDKDIYDSLSIL